MGGNNNTIIGAGADVSAGSRKHSIAIGRNAIVTADNTMQIGAATGDPKLNTVNVGDVSASTINAGAFTVGSDMRFKNFIFPLETKYGLSFINNLKPVTYNLISNGKNTIGLIAQDVEKVDESSYFTGSFINENNVEMKTVDYNKIVIPLIKAVQELSDEIDRLKKEIEELKK